MRAFSQSEWNSQKGENSLERKERGGGGGYQTIAVKTKRKSSQLRHQETTCGADPIPNFSLRGIIDVTCISIAASDSGPAITSLYHALCSASHDHRLVLTFRANTPHCSIRIIPFFFTVMKIKKKGKSMTIFHQSLFLCRFLFFARVWGSRIISRSLLEVRTSIYESATEWWRWFEEKYRQDWHKCSFWTRKSGFEIPLCWHGALLSYL